MMLLSRGARRRTVLLAIVAMFVLAGAALGWACTTIATLDISPATVSPGQTGVAVTGNSFSSSPLDGPVQLTWNGPSGPVLATARSGLLDNGQVRLTMSIPGDATPGYYVVIASQYNVLGRPVPGTPARAIVQVAG